MKIHEYQAKELFRQFSVPVPQGQVAFTVDQAVAAADALGGYPVVVKAQIHAGGRGKGGGVVLADDSHEVRSATENIMGMTLVTHQTGPAGKVVEKVLVEAGQQISHEYYLSMLVDRDSAKVVIMASAEGGMDIEEVAAQSPEKIIKVFVDPLTGLGGFHIRELFFGLELPASTMKEFAALIKGLYGLFISKDCSLLEINPLILTDDERLLALDGKIDLDSNGLYRQPELRELRDLSEEDPLEIEASNCNLNYINLDGNVGNIVNGAGLAMATMDIIKQAGAEPANFLDVGGGATAEMVENALRIILKDPKVKVVLINIFGGILRCDVFAQGVVEAANKCAIDLPVIIRMAGTNVEEGREILAASDLELINANDLADAASKVAEAVGQQVN